MEIVQQHISAWSSDRGTAGFTEKIATYFFPSPFILSFLKSVELKIEW